MCKAGSGSTNGAFSKGKGMTLSNGKLLAAAVVAGGAMLPLAPADADTIAHWRFEDGNFLADSSSNNHVLTNNGDNASAYTLPGTGAGSAFSNPIPQTGASNGTAVQRSASNGHYLHAADHDDFTSDTFTIEAMINVSERSGNGFLAGQWGGSNATNSYAVFLRDAGGVSLVLGDGSTTFVDSAFSLALNTDYYLAVSVDLTGTTAGERSATFYLQDLTNGGELLVETKTGIGVSSVNASSAPFAIGARGDGNNASSWGGIVDEVRYSNTALSQGELLVVPEPSGAMLIGGGLALLLSARRRQTLA